jgi:hypothetical protein
VKKVTRSALTLFILIPLNHCCISNTQSFSEYYHIYSTYMQLLSLKRDETIIGISSCGQTIVKVTTACVRLFFFCDIYGVLGRGERSTDKYLYIATVCLSVCVLDIVNWVFLVVAFTDDHDIIPKTAHARDSV